MFDVILKNGEHWIICGGRDFADQQMFDNAMGDVIRLRGIPDHIIHGDARGADTMANEWAVRHGLEVTPFHADWNKHGKAAGPMRNQQMLDSYPIKRLVAFPGGRGTADMMLRARKAGVEVIEIQPTPGAASSGGEERG